MSDDVTVADVLDRALELLEQGWCQWSLARNATGRVTPLWGADARSFCLTGALSRAQLDLGTISLYGVAADALAAQLPEHFRTAHPEARYRVVIYNDAPSRSQEDVILLVKRAREAIDDE